jgi:hypothetical protein
LDDYLAKHSDCLDLVATPVASGTSKLRPSSMISDMLRNKKRKEKPIDQEIINLDPAEVIISDDETDIVVDSNSGPFDIAEDMGLHNENVKIVLEHMKTEDVYEILDDEIVTEPLVTDEVKPVFPVSQRPCDPNSGHIKNIINYFKTLNIKERKTYVEPGKLGIFSLRRKMITTIEFVELAPFLDPQEAAVDRRPDNLCSGAQLKHNQPLFAKFRYRQQLFREALGYKVLDFFCSGVQQWIPQLDKNGKDFVDEELIISYELFRQVHSSIVINATTDIKMAWDRLVGAAKVVSSVNIDKDVLATTPLVTKTCFVALEMHKQHIYECRNLDFPPAPIAESSSTGPDVMIDSNSHRLKRLRKMSDLNSCLVKNCFLDVLSAFQSAATFMGERLSDLIPTTHQQLRSVRLNALLANHQYLKPSTLKDLEHSSEISYKQTLLLLPLIPMSLSKVGLITATTVLRVRDKLNKLWKRGWTITLPTKIIFSVASSLLLSVSPIWLLSTLAVLMLGMILLKLLLALSSLLLKNSYLKTRIS